MGIPKNTHWGVDSFNPINKRNFDFVERNMKQKPEFWCRYLGRADSQFKKEEIAFLRDNHPETRLLLIFNGRLDFVVDNAPNPPGSAIRVSEFVKGTVDGMKVVSAANAINEILDIPEGVTIYANVEPPPSGQVSSSWLAGFWSTTAASKFGVGGIYGNTSDDRFVTNIGPAYVEALSLMVPRFTVNPPLWSAKPTKGQKTPPAQINFEYGPGEPVKGAAVVWQYGLNFFPTPNPNPDKPPIGRFDADLATQRGFDAMWKLPAPPRTGPAGPSLNFIIPGVDAEETIHVVVRGDNLSKLARRFYGKESLWPKIYEANRATIGGNPNLIKPGQRLVIPK